MVDRLFKMFEFRGLSLQTHISMVITSFNRPFQSQTDLFGTKILTPQFFLENILALCPKVGGSENFPPLDPLGPQNPYLGVRPPKTEKLPILQGIFFYLLADHVGH